MPAETTANGDTPGASEEASECAPVEQWVRGVIGVLLDDLVIAMRDHLSPPLTLPPNEHAATRVPVLTAAYDACANRLEQRLADNPAQVAEARGRLPWHLADPKDEHLIATLLEAATFTEYYAFDQATFAAKDRTARLYTVHPELLDDTDDDGLLHISGHEVTAQVFFTAAQPSRITGSCDATSQDTSTTP